jgi:hypothetical protein
MKVLAQSHEMQERFEEAASLRQYVVKLQRETLGPDHPQYFYDLLQLAIVHHSGGRHTDAEGILIELAPNFEAQLGASHPYTLDTQEAIGNTYRGLGRYAEVETRLQEVSKL